MTITFNQDGSAQCLYTEEIPLQDIGTLKIERNSLVEFNNERQFWQVTSPDDTRRVLFMHESRQECLNWEHAYFER